MNETLDRVFEIIMLLLPIVAAIATWFLRTYVKSAKVEKDVAAIVRLSNAAIDFAEDLDKRGDLGKYLKMWNMPDDVMNLTSDGLKKLNLAGRWLETELGRQGIQMTDEEAKAWIAAQFQKRVGDMGRERTVAARAEEAVRLLQALARSGLINLPADPAQAAQLADQVTGWALAQPEKEPDALLREEAMMRVRGQLSAPLPPSVAAAAPSTPAAPSLEVQLSDLARQSVQYVARLKADHELTLPDMDIAVAWVLTEVTKQGLAVTTEQIASAVHGAFGESGMG
jgi:hypothetical protein